MRFRIGLVLVAFVCLFGITPARSEPTMSRVPIVSGLDDAWQRGMPNEPYGQDATNDIIYLGRSDQADTRMNGGLRFHTGLVGGQRVTSAFLEGFNDFGQSYTGCMYGDLTAGSPDFSDMNPTILTRTHTSRCVTWQQTSIPMRLGYTPDISPIVNELTGRPGFDGTVTILILGGGGRDNQSIDWRSFENPSGPVPLLEYST